MHYYYIAVTNHAQGCNPGSDKIDGDEYFSFIVVSQIVEAAACQIAFWYVFSKAENGKTSEDEGVDPDGNDGPGNPKICRPSGHIKRTAQNKITIHCNG